MNAKTSIAVTPEMQERLEILARFDRVVVKLEERPTMTRFCHACGRQITLTCGGRSVQHAAPECATYLAAAIQAMLELERVAAGKTSTAEAFAPLDAYLTACPLLVGLLRRASDLALKHLVHGGAS